MFLCNDGICWSKTHCFLVPSGIDYLHITLPRLRYCVVRVGRTIRTIINGATQGKCDVPIPRLALRLRSACLCEAHLIEVCWLLENDVPEQLHQERGKEKNTIILLLCISPDSVKILVVIHLTAPLHDAIYCLDQSLDSLAFKRAGALPEFDGLFASHTTIAEVLDIDRWAMTSKSQFD